MNKKKLEAGNTEIPFGKYKDSSIWWTYDEDPNYLDWLANNGTRTIGNKAFFRDLDTYLKAKDK